MFRRWFLDHPHSVGESYFEHQQTAFRFATSLFAAAVACFIHGLVPSLFKRTASTTVTQLHDRMVLHRVREKALVPDAVRLSEPALFPNGANARKD
ncbi:MAG TPA: DUF6356 family protein [Micropepsaceae bacterium]|nr:DUF6356 family protein [Micropepsaceae bacterium]